MGGACVPELVVGLLSSICVCGVLNKYACQVTRTFHRILYGSLGPTNKCT